MLIWLQPLCLLLTSIFIDIHLHFSFNSFFKSETSKLIRPSKSNKKAFGVLKKSHSTQLTKNNPILLMKKEYSNRIGWYSTRDIQVLLIILFSFFKTRNNYRKQIKLSNKKRLYRKRKDFVKNDFCWIKIDSIERLSNWVARNANFSHIEGCYFLNYSAAYITE